MQNAPDPPDRLNALDAKINAARRDSTVLPPSPSDPAPSDAEGQRLAARAGGELIGGILGGALFGYCFDLAFATRPAGIAVGLLLGAVAGFYGLWRLLKTT